VKELTTVFYISFMDEWQRCWLMASPKNRKFR
jgi:hypothetical protein